MLGDASPSPQAGLGRPVPQPLAGSTSSSSSCARTATCRRCRFVDAHGMTCADWSTVVCDDTSRDECEYTDQEWNDILENCKSSCDNCDTVSAGGDRVFRFERPKNESAPCTRASDRGIPNRHADHDFRLFHILHRCAAATPSKLRHS